MIAIGVPRWFGCYLLVVLDALLLGNRVRTTPVQRNTTTVATRNSDALLVGAVD